MAARTTFTGLNRPRTREVLRRYAMGQMQKDIAADMGMSYRQVNTLCLRYKDHVMALMDARDRAAIEAATALDLDRLGLGPR